ncbi:MAG: IS21 family transposase [Pseudomonadales bacterium]|nr:IS21 family transposase [Pseudomonadales bacterium]
MGMLAKIRRMYFRDKVPLREIARQTGLSRNTLRHWLRQGEMREPAYPARVVPSILDPYKEQLVSWLRADSHRPKRDRRTAKVLFQLLQAQGYPGGYARVAIFAKQWREAGGAAPARQAFIPLRFAPGEAFQFDWSCEYAIIAGIRRRLEVAHIKLAHSRAFLVVAYPLQTHEMLFDAHARAFAAFGGIPRRGIYDNMKTAVDKVGRGKERTVNARFLAMTGHYLFEPEFCNRAAGWEKGVVEKNVQDRRRQLWVGANARHWSSLADLNDWLASECRAAWADMRHPDCPDLTLASVLEDEQPHLMPNPQPFDGYIEQPVRVSATALVHYQRSRYSVPAELAHQVISLRVYPWELVLVAEGEEVARHQRAFDRYQTIYDWRHYIGILQRKPGALRNGAPFTEMPERLQMLQRHLLRHEGGDRVMAQVLAAVASEGLEPVLVAVELALESGNISGDHILNVLARLQSPVVTLTPVETSLTLNEEPEANVHRYDHLRSQTAEEVNHVE